MKRVSLVILAVLMGGLFLHSQKIDIDKQTKGQLPADRISGTMVGDISAKKFRGCLDASSYTGDFGQKLTLALAEIPADGGCIDARSITGAQSFSTDVTLNKSHVTILLGNIVVDQGAHQVIVPAGMSNISVKGEMGAWAGSLANNMVATGGSEFLYSGTGYAWTVPGDPTGVTWTRYLKFDDIGIRVTNLAGLGGIHLGDSVELVDITRPRIRLYNANTVGSSIVAKTTTYDPIYSALLNIHEPELSGGLHGVVSDGWNVANVVGGRIQAGGKTWGTTGLGEVYSWDAGTGYQAGDVLAVAGGTGGTIQLTSVSAPDETLAIPGGGPFTVTVSHAAIWESGAGVTYQATGLPLYYTSSTSPAAGYYYVDLVAKNGIYTFNSADAGKSVVIAYSVNGAIGGGGNPTAFTIANKGTGYSVNLTGAATSGSAGTGFTVQIQSIGELNYLKQWGGTVAGTSCVYVGKGDFSGDNVDLENCDVGIHVKGGKSFSSRLHADGCCVNAAAVFDGSGSHESSVRADIGPAIQINGARSNNFETPQNQLIFNSVLMDGQVRWARWEGTKPLDVWFSAGHDTAGVVTLHLADIISTGTKTGWLITKSASNEFSVIDTSVTPSVQRMIFEANKNTLFNTASTHGFSINYANGSTGAWAWYCGAIDYCAKVDGGSGGAAGRATFTSFATREVGGVSDQNLLSGTGLNLLGIGSITNATSITSNTFVQGNRLTASTTANANVGLTIERTDGTPRHFYLEMRNDAALNRALFYSYDNSTYRSYFEALLDGTFNFLTPIYVGGNAVTDSSGNILAARLPAVTAVVWSGFVGNLAGTSTTHILTPVRPITIERMEFALSGSMASCTTAPIVVIRKQADASTLTSLTLSTGAQFFDSGALSIAASTAISIRVNTAGVGCSITQGNFTVQYKMQ